MITTAVGAGPRRAAAATARTASVPIVGVAAVAVALRLVVLARSGGLTTAIEYDDGVHYAVSALLLHGVLPYRDEVFLQPPGIAVLLLPFAALGRLAGDATGLAAARIATCLVGGVTTWLVGRLAARTAGPRAGVVAAAVQAAAAGSLIAESTVLLEPYLNLLTVLSLDRLSRRGGGRRDALLAGLFLGAAATVKLWALAPFVVAVGWLAWRRRGDLLVRYVAGVIVAAVAVAGPFVLLAPTAALRDTTLTQLTRPGAGTTDAWRRVEDMVGLAPAGRPPFLALLLTVVAIGAVAALAARAVRRSLTGRLAAAQLALSVAMFCLSAPYFSHYADFLAPPIALLVGVGVAGWRRSGRLAIAGALLGAFLLAEAAGVVARTVSAPVSVDRLRAALPGSGCVLADQAVLAAYAGSLTAGCPSWPDPRGTALAELRGRSVPGFYPSGFRRLDRWQQRWLDWGGRAGAAVLTGPPCGHEEWRPDVCGYFTSHFRLVAVVGAASPSRLPVQVWVRRPGPGSPARQATGR